MSRHLVRVLAYKPADEPRMREGFWCGPISGYYFGRPYSAFVGTVLWKRCFEIGAWYIETWWEEKV
jgi:hypothetical protein